MSKQESDKTVTVFIVSSNGDEEDDDWFPQNFEDMEEFEPSVMTTRKTSKKTKIEKPPKIPLSQRFKINKGSPINCLLDLIVAFNHEEADEHQKNLVSNLHELNDMIGMTKLKDQIVNQILFFIQDLQEPGMFLHTVLTGPPGCGKSTTVNVLAKIYSNLGVLETNKVTRATRADLVGKWLGSTAIKTKELLDSAKGGVLLLDEVYSLGSKDGSDSFSKECIDTINQYLSEHADELICVIAGYKDKVEECFFNQNPGLNRRFPWRFSIDAYDVGDLHKIMKLQLNKSGWKFDDSVSDIYIDNLIQSNKEFFTGNGGDTQNLIDKCKIAHARRAFTMVVIEEEVYSPPLKRRRVRKKSDKKSDKKDKIATTVVKTHRILSKKDIELGFEAFKQSKGKNNPIKDYMMSTMFI